MVRRKDHRAGRSCAGLRCWAKENQDVAEEGACTLQVRWDSVALFVDLYICYIFFFSFFIIYTFRTLLLI